MTTAAIALEKLLPRWRAKLPARYSPEYIDGFIARNRSALAAIVERAMMYRRVKQGTPPTTPEEFAAYAAGTVPPDSELHRRLSAANFLRGADSLAVGRDGEPLLVVGFDDMLQVLAIELCSDGIAPLDEFVNAGPALRI